MSIQIVPYDAVQPSTYNPRLADEARLDLVGLSLSKLGFLLPIVAHKSGEIVSGHQRHLVAGRLGFTEVPVQYIDVATEADRKALNIVFNRGTNDMSVADHSDGMSEELLTKRVMDLAKSLPDAADRFRCATAGKEPLAPLAAECRGRYDPYMRNMARALHTRAKMQTPIVVSASGKVLNGVGRVQFGMERGMDSWAVVRVSDAEAEFSEAMLNLLSMDFDIHTRYEDTLRVNSFRRERLKRTHLGTGFTAELKPVPKRTSDFDIKVPSEAARWIKAYGDSVVDFGAGHLHETKLLRGAGVHVAPFEPFRCGKGGEVDRNESIRVAEAFLADVESGKEYTSVFVSSVFNSIPFTKDRQHVIAICAALCGPRGTFHGNAMSVKHGNYSSVLGAQGFSERRQAQATFALQYEGGIVLGDFMDKPKVQKYHTGKEFYDLLKTGFARVNVRAIGNNLHGIGRGAIIDPQALRKALDFEFNLVYPDGKSMGLAAQAITAFSKRLDLEL